MLFGSLVVVPPHVVVSMNISIFEVVYMSIVCVSEVMADARRRAVGPWHGLQC
jgi:hypothetical protein